MSKDTIDVNGVKIHYEKVGSGSNVVLLLPGGIGTSRTDFTPQLEQMNQRNFTLIAWDPPGYGYSRPPERVYEAEATFYSDADIAAALMKKLGYSLYSLMGWSDGAKTALVMSIKYQSSVDKLVIWGGNSYVTPAEHRALASTEDTHEWTEAMKEPYITVYGKERFQSMWSKHIEFYRTLSDICKQKVNQIRCPTLILHGERDVLCPTEHPAYLAKTIPDSQIHKFPQGGHNIHHVYAKEFNRMVETFLLE